MYDISTLKEKKISELQDIAKSLKIKKIKICIYTHIPQQQQQQQEEEE